MNAQGISIISTLVNFLLSAGKIIIGVLFNSIAIVSEGIHSLLDVISSFITYLGIKGAKKGETQKYQFGQYKKESLAGLAVTILLFVSAIWILYEGIERFRGGEFSEFTYWGIGIIIVSLVVNEVMARAKFYYANKENSLALSADAEHSRADVIASLGVLIGLILVKWFPIADAIVAIFVGIYIMYESFVLGKEISDSLLDVSNPKLEKEIQKFLKEKKISFESIKTRLIGSYTSVELEIKLDPKLKIEQAEKESNKLEKMILDNFEQAKQVIIKVGSHAYTQSVLTPSFAYGTGRKYRFRGKGKFETIGPEKIGKRIIIPLDNGEINPAEFGSKNYLIVDVKNNKIIQKKKIKNPYFKDQGGHGVRFIKSIQADEVYVKHIGQGASNMLKSLGIKINLLEKDIKLSDLINKWQ